MPRKSEHPSTTPRMVAVDNIVGLAEIAERTGSTPHAVWNWTKRYDGDHPFPKPIAVASGRPVYDWVEVEEWNNNWVRSKGGWHTHKTQRDGTKKSAPRRQFMEGDDDDSRPARAKKTTAKRTTKRAASKPAEHLAPVTPIRRARRSRARKA
jgi:predicted DNA-binding transcriptional regulator AlpA